MNVTAAICPGMLLSVMKDGIMPPGVADVAMRHSTSPFSNSTIHSTATYRPLVPFLSSFASSWSSERSIGIETIVLKGTSGHA